MEHPPEDSAPSVPERRWRPLAGIDRRVAGVLVEKAKTTPDVYPMTLNGIRTGCNQKSNRQPLMELELDQVEESLDRLREVGAVGLVEGYGRVQKYRHYLYDWLGVDKVEMAVMTELLLRGAQTVGELRARAARMEPIADQAALRPVLESLKAKGLVIELTPAGRGQIVSHALFTPREMESLKSKVHTRTESAPRESTSSTQSVGAGNEQFFQELEKIRVEMTQVCRELNELRENYSRTVAELQALKESLGETS